MASMRDIKRRKESIQSTGQITKAMKLVSTVKLQKAKGKAESTKPYFDYMYDTIAQILKKSGNIDHKYLKSNPDNTKKAVIVISSNRGLAGGYNSNIIKLVTGLDADKEDVLIYAIGRKAKETLAKKGYSVEKDYSEVINSPLYSDAMSIGKQVISDYTDGKFGEIYLAYTEFKNTVTHIPKLIKLLPFTMEVDEDDEKTVDDLTLMNFEPNEEEALDMIIPKYINSLIYGGIVEAIASENGARMQAMDSATNNAQTMIDDLSLKYNRARQASITQEITEIVAGASAIN